MFKFFSFLLIIYHFNESLANITKVVVDEKALVTTAEKKSRLNIVSFEPLGEHIDVGLDFILPFLKVPITRTADAYGNEPALLNINTAALVSTGLLATTSALISFIFRKYVILGREDTSSENRRRSDYDYEHEFWLALNNFKLVYRNSSGNRVDTSLAGLFKTIDETFQRNEIDLNSCLQKVVCSRIHSSSQRVSEGNPSGVDKIIDGLMGLKWFKESLHQTFLNDAVVSNHPGSLVNCGIKYPKCKWSMPESKLKDIIGTYLKFT